MHLRAQPQPGLGPIAGSEADRATAGHLLSPRQRRYPPSPILVGNFRRDRLRLALAASGTFPPTPPRSMGSRHRTTSRARHGCGGRRAGARTGIARAKQGLRAEPRPQKNTARPGHRCRSSQDHNRSIRITTLATTRGFPGPSSVRQRVRQTSPSHVRRGLGNRSQAHFRHRAGESAPCRRWRGRCCCAVSLRGYAIAGCRSATRVVTGLDPGIAGEDLVVGNKPSATAGLPGTSFRARDTELTNLNPASHRALPAGVIRSKGFGCPTIWVWATCGVLGA